MSLDSPFEKNPQNDMPASLSGSRMDSWAAESRSNTLDVEQAWAEEANRRYRAYLKGEEVTVPVEDVLLAIRTEFNL